MNETRRLGASGLSVSALGIGVWSWGDKSYWGYGTSFSRADVQAAFEACLEAGVNFFDTAEVYGNGASEKLLGECIAAEARPVAIASKFAPLPNRLRAGSLAPALEASLKRLGKPQLDLYQIHWPFSLIKIEDLMDALAEAVQSKLVRAVGVSNYNSGQMRRAYQALARHGIALASNQVNYSLIKRKPEINGVLQTCRELNVALIAYSPLGQGVLTGKFDPEKGAPNLTGYRPIQKQFRASGRREVAPLINTLRQIARERERTVEQVALNWLLSRDELVIPIPGAKNRSQATSNTGSIGWRLSEAEFDRIDKASALYRR